MAIFAGSGNAQAMLVMLFDRKTTTGVTARRQRPKHGSNLISETQSVLERFFVKSEEMSGGWAEVGFGQRTMCLS
jgi:hypothetical protein